MEKKQDADGMNILKLKNNFCSFPVNGYSLTGNDTKTINTGIMLTKTAAYADASLAVPEFVNRTYSLKIN